MRNPSNYSNRLLTKETLCPKSPVRYSDLEIVARLIWSAGVISRSELLRRVNWRGITAAQLSDFTRQLIRLGAITSNLDKPPWKRPRQVYTWKWGIRQDAEPTAEESIWSFRRFCQFLRQQQPASSPQNPDALVPRMAA